MKFCIGSKTKLALALGALLLAGGGEAAAQDTARDGRLIGEPATADRSEVIVVTQRPLRTFRGEAVRVGRYSDNELSIGVVRPLREVPSYDGRSEYSRLNRFDRSDRWRTRELARGRIVLDAYPDRFSRVEKSIGVVRAYRTYDPVVRNAPRTFTNQTLDTTPGTPGSATGGTDAGATVTRTSDQPIVAVSSTVEVPEDAQSDPWALLNQGYYREARTLFDAEPDADESVMTGRALAAAMSGDLTAASELMPDSPTLPDDTALRDHTRRRIELIREYLYEDDAAMQSALQGVLDASASAEASAH